MKLLSVAKDGGPESKVTGLFIVEIKGLFSVVLLHFANGSREAYHSHAFNALSWLLRGRLKEHRLTSHWDGVPVGPSCEYTPSWRPIFTGRKTFHKVVSEGDTWVLSFRGPWADTWREYIPARNAYVTLTHGREVA